MTRLRTIAMFSSFFITILLWSGCEKNDSANQLGWEHRVRIAGHPLSMECIDSIIHKAGETHVFGIEVDNDITGRYESFLDPAKKLAEIEAVAKRAHQEGNRTFVYIAGLECITSNADEKQHTFFKDHPDWVQRDMSGRPAIFGGDDAFWIREEDEDVWISPYAKEWRERYMEHVRSIAATGIDGIFIDIPYWMTHFDGWEDTWASFDDYTVMAFRERTGLDAFKDVDLGNFQDPGFRLWIRFRISTLTEFLSEIDRTIKSVNPECKTIAEIYPGIGEAAVRVGADVYEIYTVVDAIAHEYSEGAYMAAGREPFDWFRYMAGMHTFRAFAGDKPSWMLSYSWDGEEQVEHSQAMQNLFMSHLIAGTNTWDARGHIMSGSNDYETRKKVFCWIGEYEQWFYSPRRPLKPVGVYFSPATRNYFSDSHVESYMGIITQLMHNHIEFQIVTPRSLNAFNGTLLILPDVRCLDEKEIAMLTKKTAAGMYLVSCGETGRYDCYGMLKEEFNPDLNNISQAPFEIEFNSIYLKGRWFRNYLIKTRNTFDEFASSGNFSGADFSLSAVLFLDSLFHETRFEPAIHIDAPPSVFAQTAQVEGSICIYLANFSGLKGGITSRQVQQDSITININKSLEITNAEYLSFLNSIELLDVYQGEVSTVVRVPSLDKAGVVRLYKN